MSAFVVACVWLGEAANLDLRCDIFGKRVLVWMPRTFRVGEQPNYFCGDEPMDQAVELRMGELFAGAGGLSLGFILTRHAGMCFRPIFAVDNDAASLESYRYNMKWLEQNAPEILPRMPGIFERDVEKLNVPAVLRLLKLKRG